MSVPGLYNESVYEIISHHHLLNLVESCVQQLRQRRHHRAKRVASKWVQIYLCAEKIIIIHLFHLKWRLGVCHR